MKHTYTIPKKMSNSGAIHERPLAASVVPHQEKTVIAARVMMAAINPAPMRPPQVARTLTGEGRASDGRPIKPGDTFRTLSGRTTTPFPSSRREKQASQWLIDNAVLEAQARCDDFNATGFGCVKPLKGGELTPSDRDSMLLYLFCEQPPVAPRGLLRI